MDRLGGWSVGGIGESYGTGYPIEVLSKWLSRGIMSAGTTLDTGIDLKWL